ncbi:hypothetical protein FK85_30875 [Halorubrum saccharovorum]|uniref:Uncharacterized protein n=1 Tax=Halorubrum saccharovorum TaxID=2248 RepID=A0A0F8CJP4_9EURY|nr:hypothetical protein FK85_30875 [Halorubrum saccharovorum]
MRTGLRRLDRLDNAERLAGGDLVVDVREFDEHHVAEFVLREVGDADPNGVAAGRRPLVRFQVPSVVGYFEAHWSGVSAVRLWDRRARALPEWDSSRRPVRSGIRGRNAVRDTCTSPF